MDILIVDDDAADILIFKEALAQTGFRGHLHTASDGEHAVSFLQGNKTPGLVVLDLNMPRMDGHEVLCWIRAQEHLNSLPIIIFTTSDSPQDITRCRQNGADLFITKPVHFGDYEDIIKRMLGLLQLDRSDIRR